MTDERWLTPEQQRAWRAFQRLRTVLPSQIFRELNDQFGLSEPDYDVLSHLSETPGHRSRLRDLADHMLWSRSRLSHHVERMVRRGLVAREDDPHDARGCLVVLTRSGLSAIEAAAPAHVGSVRRNLINILTEEQIQALAEISESVVTHLGDTASAASAQDPSG
jgi:DNA-binding MarR family transcriptional regulator